MKKSIKIIWLIVGILSLVIGAIGAVLPFLPTFPFLMLTLFSFGKSSQRLHEWFIGTKLYKNNLDSFVVNKSMTKKTKITILTSVSIVMGIGFAMMGRVPVARAVLVIVWLCHILYFVFAVKTCEE